MVSGTLYLFFLPSKLCLHSILIKVVVGRCNYGDVVVTSCEHVLVLVFGGSSSGESR